MKNILLIIYCLSLLSVDGFGQEYRVVDAENKESLPYATVLFRQTSKGVYADRDGVFRIPSNYQLDDTISISMVGYTSLDIKISDLTDTIFLEKTAYNLQSIVVTPNKKRKSTTVGFISFKKRAKWVQVFSPSKVAVYIKNDTGESQIVDKLLYRHRQYDKDVRFVVRPQVYTVNEDGAPGDPLLNKAETIMLSGNGILEIYCEDTLIFPPEGLFVAIELIETVDDEGLPITIKEPIGHPFISTLAARELSTYISVELVQWTGYLNILRVGDVAINAMFGLSYK